MYNVLLADDEPYVIKGLKLMIDWNEYGFEIVNTAFSGTEALEQFKKQEPDLMLIDIMMPGIDGIELIKAVRSMGYKGEIIILTGSDDFNVARQAMKYGVRFFINKPIDTDEIGEALVETKKSLDNKNRFSGGIDCSEAQKGDLIKNRKMEYNFCDAKGIISFYTGGEHIEIIDFPEGVYIYEMSLTGISYVIAKDTDFNKLSEIVFNRLANTYPRLIAARMLIEKSSVKECAIKLDIFLQCKVNSKYGSLFDVRDCPQVIINPSEISEYANELMERIEVYDAPGADKIIVNFFERLSDCVNPVGCAVAFKSFILVSCSSVLLKQGVSMSKLIKKYSSEEICDVSAIRRHYYVVKRLSLLTIEALKKHRKDVDGTNLDAAEKYVQEHFREQIAIQDIAKALYMNPGYLGSAFSKKIGMSIKEYIHTLRMKEVIRLMYETDMTLNQISYEVGYNNYNNFFFRFERYFGMTPKEYKQKIMIDDG